MDNIERTISNIQAYIWLALTIFCLGGAIIKGAWWHLFTAGISYVMYKAFYVPKEDRKTTE